MILYLWVNTFNTENTFITSTEGANDPEVATEDDADKSIGKLKIMNYYSC